MKRILLPTDFSSNSWNAISYSLELFKNESCTFYLLNAYTPMVYTYDYSFGGGAVISETLSGEDIIRKTSVNGLEEIVTRINKEFPNELHQYETISAYNILTDEINDLITSLNIDLVIMGTKGATGAQEILFGTQTVYVMKKAKCPVLAIPQHYKHREVKDILFPNDYKYEYVKDDFDTLKLIATTTNSSVHILHISNELELSDKQEENKNRLNSFFQEIKHDYTDVPNRGISEAVATYIYNHNINMLVMTNRKHSFLERLLFRQSVDTIGMHIKIPFLVIPV